MLFGPHPHSLTQYSSLPRRSATSAFQRNTPVRRSTGIPENHMEYFVPRSISEFNLSGVGDLALPPPRRSPTLNISTAHNLQGGMMQQTMLCGTGPPPPPPPAQLQIIMKPREKMVTFEDESNAMKGATTATHCPHGVPTTPRKATSSNTLNANIVGNATGGSGLIASSDVFM